MRITKAELLAASKRAGLSTPQSELLWDELEKNESLPESKFDLAHVLYYIGALIVISAMAWFLGTGWDRFGGLGILCITLSYIVIFLLVGRFLWQKKELKTPGGLFITIAISLIPLSIYGFQLWTGWWPDEPPGNYLDFYHWIKGSWFAMEVGTIIGACLALRFYPFPFLTAPLFFAVWFMSMDLTPLIFQKSYEWNDYAWVSLWVGLATLVIAYVVDQKTKRDFAFWGYLFGMMAFWSGLSLLDTSSEFDRFLYCLINIGLILLSILLQRKVFLIFGALGLFGYIGSLFYRYFYDSSLFPFILSAIGVVIVFLGVAYNRHHTKIEQAILNSLPTGMKKYLPQSRK